MAVVEKHYNYRGSESKGREILMAVYSPLWKSGNHDPSQFLAKVVDDYLLKIYKGFSEESAFVGETPADCRIIISDDTVETTHKVLAMKPDLLINSSCVEFDVAGCDYRGISEVVEKLRGLGWDGRVLQTMHTNGIVKRAEITSRGANLCCLEEELADAHIFRNVVNSCLKLPLTKWPRFSKSLSG